MLGAFVTGTDTGVGKTVVSSLLVAALRRFRPVGYWKPIQTGIEEDDDTAEVCRLASCTTGEIVDDGVRLPRPLSPHLSARLAGRSVTIADLSPIAERLSGDRYWIVEGAGGVLVPINDSEMMLDLMIGLGLPAVVASRSGLGTINHTLLTVAQLRRRSISVAGVVMVGRPNRENRKAIEQYGDVSVLAELPQIEDLGPESIARAARSMAPSLKALVGQTGEGTAAGFVS